MTKATRNPIKKWIMRQYWRMQQSQSIISMVLLGSTLTLLIWPYVRWRFEQWPTFLGIPTAYLGLIGIFFCLILGVLTIGFFYDRVFSLWTELRSVDIERNPYWTYALSPTWVMMMATNAEILKHNADGDEELIKHADWILNWCKKCADSEMFGRAVQNWDRDMEETPTFWFLDEETMKKARSYNIIDED